MKTKAVLAAAFTTAAVAASAQHNWILTSSYEFSLGPEWEGARITELIATMEGDAIDGSYGWGSTAWSFDEDSSPITLTFDTEWFDPFAAEPVLTGSMMLGVATDLPNQAPGQKHVVLFMNDDAASNVAGIAWGTIFTTTLEEQLIDAIERAVVDFDDEEAWNFIEEFTDVAAKNANVGPGGLPGSIWFGPNADFSIVAFSEGQVIGSGTSSFDTEFVPVPEPATLAALGLGAVGLLRRRKH